MKGPPNWYKSVMSEVLRQMSVSGVLDLLETEPIS